VLFVKYIEMMTAQIELGFYRTTTSKETNIIVDEIALFT